MFPLKCHFNTLLKILVVSILCLSLAGFPDSTRVHASLLAGTTIEVTTEDDELNNDGDCSLREALRAANLDTAVDACPAGSGHDYIQIPLGTYILTRTGSGEDQGVTGDLDINGNVTIAGVSPSATIIDGNATDRVFHITTGGYQVKISSLTIRNGVTSALTGGAGILNENGNLDITRCDLNANHSDYTGGGLDNRSGQISMIDVSVTNNTAERGGGVLNSGRLSMRRVTLVGNHAEISGGGLDNAKDGTLINVTFSANTTDDQGGGIFNDNILVLLNCTLTANDNAVFLNGGDVRFKNTIVADSTAGDNCAYKNGVSITLGYNLDSGDTCNFHDPTTDLINTPPNLGPLQDNEGPTLTHALLGGSLAIDRGDNIDCPKTDQRGAFRPADGGSGIICDMGAFEYNASFPLLLFLPFLGR